MAALRRSIMRILENPSNDGATPSRLALFFDLRLVRRWSTKPVIVPFGRRSRIWISPAHPSSMQAVYAPLPDYPEMRVWEAHLRPGDLFVDVGAHLGFYSIIAAELGAEVVAIEPQVDLTNQLHENLGLNGYSAAVHRVAVSAAPGRMVLGGGSDPSQHSLSSDGVGIEVPVTTLDNLLGERAAAGIKLDVEGAERLVLEGGRRLLAEGRVEMIQIEWNRACERNFGETREPLASLLSSFGYSLYRPDPTGVLYPTDGRDYGRDVFAVRRP